MDWLSGKALDRQLSGLGLDADLGGTGARESKFSVFGTNAAADVEVEAAVDTSSDVKNFPPLLKLFYVGELSSLRIEAAQKVLRRSRALLVATCATLFVNLGVNVYVTAIGADLGWLGLVLSPILGFGFVMLACTAYAMTFRGARFSSANVMRNASFMDIALIAISLLYTLMPVINFNGWFRFLVFNYGDVVYKVLVAIEALIWTVLTIARVFVLISLNQVIEILSGEGQDTFTTRTSNAARAESLAQIRNTYRGNGTTS
ncbi:hypothetical protein FVE85_7000 [Porphyridium purpureum]|uniref:Uncharacterized protein n=1 Tax=Porphyridium purpureum TaxID=35688 RepID=A0A5J4YQZ8_PORPP|nr:hypothetical protein FVE85_3866 [Porphyridium purpureum]KAA8499415.1 hypothetical protein FVE85_7000 [Porphyridium purpureum]|eukprot:POR5280..scf295_1